MQVLPVLQVLRGAHYACLKLRPTVFDGSEPAAPDCRCSCRQHFDDAEDV